MAVPVGAAAVAVISAVASGSATRLTWAGVLASVSLAWVAVRVPPDGPLLAGQVIPLSVSASLLTICGAGLDQTAAAQSWRSIVAVAAYPFLGHALVKMVAAHRQIREIDVLVESALVATAVGIVLHVAVGDWRERTLTSAWSDAQGAFPAVLVALDVALLVVTVRGMRAPSARRGPLGCIQVGVVCLLTAHLWQELQVSQGQSAGAIGNVFALAGLLALGAAALNPAARVEPDRLLEHPVLFSSTHAAVVVIALLAAPAVLAGQAVRGVTASATVATGAVMSGLILAGYLVGILRERALTEHQATHDDLTGLPNRTLIVDRLDRSIAHARRCGGSCAVLFIDLDRFKEINDTFGHAAGDELLRNVADRLRTCIRDEDTVARLSGDEFVVLLPHLTAPDDVVVVAERVLKALGTPVTVAEERLLLSGSVGIALYPNDGDSAHDVLASADAAMYRAKDTRGNSWEVFSSTLATQAQARLHLEAGLLDGLSRDELVLHYQPIVDLPTGRTVGAEALVRWNHPEQGFLLPGHFVPIAEQSNLIVLMGEQVIFGACRELRRWQDLGLHDQFISVNVSSRQFTQGLVSVVTAALRSTGAAPHNLVVELTESTVVDNLEDVAATLEELRSLGVTAAIDDFGTGYCGLRYLGTLPVASLKIDQSFIQGMTPSAAAIVAATIAMGHSLGLTLVAEGVETAEQRRFLADQGCDRVQGYFVGRPMPSEEIIDRLRAERSNETHAPALPPMAVVDSALA
ncbi:MAG: putative bifunctional diguanylate cyclase/phosphodiesterase [Actinomycetota bacterium]